MSSVTVDNIPRDRVLVNADHVDRVSALDFPHQYYNEENTFDIENFKKNVQIKLIAGNDKKLEFDFIGLSEAFANTIRRIMIAEVPTLAIEYVRIYNNNGIIQDEVLAHRLGLIPIKADPRKFQYKRSNSETTQNTIIFNLNVECKVDNQRHVEGEGVPIINGNVYSNSIKWQPFHEQNETFKDSPIDVVYPDILITKMVPDQIIYADLLAHKGQGQDHIKFSPVATAFYRLMPEIIIQKPIEGELAHKFQKCFPSGVIGIENKNGVDTAVVANARLDRVTREVLRHEEFQDSVKLTRIRNHIIFNVETVGNMTPSEVFEESLKILKNKARRYLVKLEKLNQTD